MKIDDCLTIDDKGGGSLSRSPTVGPGSFDFRKECVASLFDVGPTGLAGSHDTKEFLVDVHVDGTRCVAIVTHDEIGCAAPKAQSSQNKDTVEG